MNTTKNKKRFTITYQ